MKLDYISRWFKAIVGGTVQVAAFVLGTISTAATFIRPLADRAPGYVRPIGITLLAFGFVYASFRAYVDMLVKAEELHGRLSGTRIELKNCSAQESIKRAEDIYGKRNRTLVLNFTLRVQNRESSTPTTLQIEDCVLNIPNASISSRKIFGDSHTQSATQLYKVIEAGVMTDVKGRVTFSLPFSETHSSVDRAIGELILTDTHESRFTLPFDVPLSKTAYA